jgi:uncharacterized protein (DUF433 family)
MVLNHAGAGLIMGMKKKSVVQIDPEIMSGAPCFAGTRVPVRALLDYIEGGETIDQVLEQYPTVTREQAVDFLEQPANVYSPPSKCASCSTNACRKILRVRCPDTRSRPRLRPVPKQHQTHSLPFAIVVLRVKSNRMIHVLPFAQEILRRISEFQPGHVYVLA